MQSTTSEARVPCPIRKPRPKPPVEARLVEAPFADGRPGTLAIAAGGESTLYALEVLDADFGGRSFLLTKEDRTSYAVNLGGPAGGEDAYPSCECKGFLRWGHLRPCKQLAALAALGERGLL